MKLLIGVPSPRNMKQVIEAYYNIDHDKYWVKYLPSREAYQEIVRFFLANEQYTHLAISPDDLVLTPEGVQMILDGIEKFDFPVLSAWCAVDSGGQPNDAAICYDLVHVNRSERNYIWISREALEAKAKEADPYIKVKHVGTPFTVFRRDAVKVADWDGDQKYNRHIKTKRHASYAQDVVICKSLAEAGIPIIVDTRVEFQHLRFGSPILRDIKPPSVWIQQILNSSLIQNEDELLA